MDEETNTIAIRGVKPPRTRTGTIFNGIGNGLMIGSIPILGYELAQQIKQGDLKNPIFTAGLCFAGAGALIGAYFGMKEAEHLKDYRTALANDLNDLHAKIDGKTAEPAR